MHKKTEGKFNDDQTRKNNLTVEYLLFHVCFCFMKLNSICSTLSNDRAFSFFPEWHAFTVKEVEGTITAEEALRYTYKLIFKQDLKEIREWGLFTEREGLMQMGRYHFQILWTLPFRFLQDIFLMKQQEAKSKLWGFTQVELKILIPPFIHWCTVK